MHSEWQSLLEQAGAVIEHGAVQHYGHAAQERQRAGQDDIVADLSHQAVVRVRGAEAEKFLQGQFTTDLRLLHDGHRHLSAYCSPKGRALAVSRFWRRGDDYYFILPAALVEPMVSRLRKYVLMSKVTFEVMNDWVHIGFADRRSVRAQPLPERTLGFKFAEQLIARGRPRQTDHAHAVEVAHVVRRCRQLT